jgi:hypothetical protein
MRIARLAGYASIAAIIVRCVSSQPTSRPNLVFACELARLHLRRCFRVPRLSPISPTFAPVSAWRYPI